MKYFAVCLSVFVALVGDSLRAYSFPAADAYCACNTLADDDALLIDLLR